MDGRLQILKECLSFIPQACYPAHSRVHPLRSFIFANSQCYVKRDDELGFGVSGSKIRKYRALIPFFLTNKIQEVMIIGSAYSNHVLSLIQLLIENGIQPTLFLRGDPQRVLQGNALLTSLFIPPSFIHWLSKAEWKNVNQLANDYAKQQSHSTFILPEGGFCSEALPGMLSLPLDIINNEQEQNLTFNHIFLEAGTGFTASALIVALHWLKHPAYVHVLLIAGNENTFISSLKLCHDMCMQIVQHTFSFPKNFILHQLRKTKGFGKLHSSLFKSISQIALQEGFLTDPIYSTKLFIESRHLLSSGEMKGNVLIHHAGGALTLLGFQSQLQQVFKNQTFLKPNSGYK